MTKLLIFWNTLLGLILFLIPAHAYANKVTIPAPYGSFISLLGLVSLIVTALTLLKSKPKA